MHDAVVLFCCVVDISVHSPFLHQLLSQSRMHSVQENGVALLLGQRVRPADIVLV